MPGEDTRFKPGFDPRRPQHRRGHSRNKLTTAFLEAFADDFEQHGVEAIQAARMADPVQYVKIAASLLPKDVSLTDGDGNTVGFIIVPAKAGTSVEADAETIGVSGSH